MLARSSLRCRLIRFVAFEQGIGERANVRLDAQEIAQHVEMQRTRRHAVRLSVAQPFEVTFARRSLEPPQRLLVGDELRRGLRPPRHEQGLSAVKAAGHRAMQHAQQQLLEAELVRKGLQVRPVLYVEGREALQTAITQGVGVGVIARTEFGGSPGVRAIALADCQVRMVESLARLADRPASNLLDALFSTDPVSP